MAKKSNKARLELFMIWYRFWPRRTHWSTTLLPNRRVNVETEIGSIQGHWSSTAIERRSRLPISRLEDHWIFWRSCRSVLWWFYGYNTKSSWLIWKTSDIMDVTPDQQMPDRNMKSKFGPRFDLSAHTSMLGPVEKERQIQLIFLRIVPFLLHFQQTTRTVG